MIRERVSTQGVIRPLEPEIALDAFQVPHEMIGNISELAIRRWLKGTASYAVKFASTVKTIEKNRRRHLELSKKEAVRQMAVLQNSIESNTRNGSPSTDDADPTVPFTNSGSWNWAWALDGKENPPPSSIVSRRDTSEARRLANIADQSVTQTESTFNANHLWSVVVNYLTVNPDRESKQAKKAKEQNTPPPPLDSSPPKRKSGFSRFAAADFLQKTETKA